MGYLQEHCSEGPKRKTAGADLTGKKNYLAHLNSSGQAVVISNAAHFPAYVIAEEGASGEEVTVTPWRDGAEKLVIGAAAIAVGAYVEFTTAGKVQTFSAGTKIAQAVTACAADGAALVVQPV